MKTSKESLFKSMGSNYYAIVAGCCSSSASFFGKLSGDLSDQGALNIWILRAVCICLMITSNALVWRFYVKALHSKIGTLRATVMSAATNYFISYVLGFIVFHESLTLIKALGIILIFSGLVLIAKDNESIEDPNRKDE